MFVFSPSLEVHRDHIVVCVFFHIACCCVRLLVYNIFSHTDVVGLLVISLLPFICPRKQSDGHSLNTMFVFFPFSRGSSRFNCCLCFFHIACCCLRLLVYPNFVCLTFVYRFNVKWWYTVSIFTVVKIRKYGLTRNWNMCIRKLCCSHNLWCFKGFVQLNLSNQYFILKLFRPVDISYSIALSFKGGYKTIFF